MATHFFQLITATGFRTNGPSDLRANPMWVLSGCTTITIIVRKNCLCSHTITTPQWVVLCDKLWHLAIIQKWDWLTYLPKNPFVKSVKEFSIRNLTTSSVVQWMIGYSTYKKQQHEILFKKVDQQNCEILTTIKGAWFSRITLREPGIMHF